MYVEFLFSSKTFLDELDVMLSLEKNVGQFLKFNEDYHKVQILDDAPDSVLSYSTSGNEFDVTKLYNNFLQNVFHVVELLSQNTKLSSDYNLENVTVKWKPCKSKRKYSVFFKIMKIMIKGCMKQV